MAVYREAWMLISAIRAASGQVFNDAADYGVKVKRGDKLWLAAKQLAEMYGENRKEDIYETGRTVSVDLRIAMEDDNPTWHSFRLDFVKSDMRELRGYAGIVSVYPTD